MRIGLDPRNLNKAVKREYFALPTIKEITTRMTGGKYQSKLYCESGYWHLCMYKESHFLTTFYSPFGRYFFLRMLSRAPIQINTNNEVEHEIECFVNMVIRNTSMYDRNLKQIMHETSKDGILQTLTMLIKDGCPDKKKYVPKEVFKY